MIPDGPQPIQPVKISPTCTFAFLAAVLNQVTIVNFPRKFDNSTSPAWNVDVGSMIEGGEEANRERRTSERQRECVCKWLGWVLACLVPDFILSARHSFGTRKEYASDPSMRRMPSIGGYWEWCPSNYTDGMGRLLTLPPFHESISP